MLVFTKLCEQVGSFLKIIQDENLLVTTPCARSLRGGDNTCRQNARLKSHLFH